MKKDLTEMVFVLDRSGSMFGMEEDTIGGFNSLIEKQKKEEGEARVTTVLFDDEYELLHDRLELDSLKAMTENEYFVRGATALLDAVGKTITKIENVQKQQPADKVIFVIITDGMENSSREYSRGQIRKMIEAEKEKGWEFMFLGANMDAVSEAGELGIRRDRAVTYTSDKRGTKLNYDGVSRAVSEMRACACSMEMSSIGDGWKREIEDYHRRDEDIASRARRKRRQLKEFME